MLSFLLGLLAKMVFIEVFRKFDGFERLEVQNVHIVKIIPAKHQLIYYIEVISQEQNTSGGFDGEDFLLARLRTPLRYPQ